MRIGSLFTGYGGLDRAVESVLGGETVWRGDIKPAACTLIEHYWPGTNLGDITTVDWSTVPPVDVITGGFPCTDISAAGKQAGLIRYGDRTRSGLWAEMAHAISILRPSLVVAENVRTLTSVRADSVVEPCPGCVGDPPDKLALRALGAVLGDLADIGYNAAWCGLSASDVGAPHGRFRIFILAWPADPNSPGRPRAGGPARGCSAPSIAGQRPDAGRGDPGAATDAIGSGRNQGRPEPARLGRRPHNAVGGPDAPTHSDRDAVRTPAVPEPGRGRPALAGHAGAAPADAAGGGQCHDEEQHREPNPATPHRHLWRRHPDGHPGATDWGPYGPAIRRWASIIGRPAPAPTEPGPSGGQRLSPRLTEWMMGLPDGWITSVPGLTRNQMLSLCGDGVVPQQAAKALRRLLPMVRERAA